MLSPVQTLAATTAVLSVPLFLFSRHRNTVLKDALRRAPPPRRAVPALPPSSSSSYTSISILTHRQPHIDTAPAFNPVLYTASALALGTTLVAAGTAVGIWAIQAAFGVHNTQEFAQRMRVAVSAALPGLSSAQARDGAEERLRDAFERGGVNAWIDAAVREAEDEAAGRTT